VLSNAERAVLENAETATGGDRNGQELVIAFVAKHSRGIAGARDPLVANSIVRSAISHRAKQSSAAAPTGGCLWSEAIAAFAALSSVRASGSSPTESRAPSLPSS
jgi:hypothetical protein